MSSRSLKKKRGLALILVLLAAIGATYIVRMNIIMKPTHSTGATWHNIVVGESNSEQVTAELGFPDNVEYYVGSKRFQYAGGDDWINGNSYRYELILQENRVIEIVDYLGYGSESERRWLSEFMAQYGKPDYITWAGGFSAYGDRQVIFLEKGIMLSVAVGLTPADTPVLTAHYFLPCSLRCVRIKYWSFFGTSHGPPDQAGRVPMEMWRTEDPWGLTSGQ